MFLSLKDQWALDLSQKKICEIREIREKNNSLADCADLTEIKNH